MLVNRKAILSAAVVAALSHASVTLAADKFWDGPVNNQWTDGTNWFGGEPGPADVAIFDNAASVQRSLVVLGADRTVSELRVTGVPIPGPYRFVSEGGTLTTGHVDIQSAAGNVTFEGFKVNTTSMTVQPGATLDLTTANAQVNASFMFINGALNWTGGGLTTSTPSGINVDGGLMTVTAGGRGLANGTTLRVFNGGTFTSNSYFDIGSSLDAGNGPTGTLSVSGAGSKFVQTAGLAALWGHNSGDHANVNISDNGLADLSSGVFIGANHGSADVLVQTGGHLRVGTALEVGVLSGSLQTGPGGGQQVRAGGGGSSGGGNQLNGTSGGFANIDITGGTFSTTANTPATFALGGAVNLSGGNLDLGGDTTFATGSTLNYSGGTMAIASGKTLTIDGGVATLSAGGRGLSNNATLQVINGGLFQSNEYFDIGASIDPGNGPVGTLLVSGSGSRFIQTAGDTPGWGSNPGDVATVTFTDHAAGTITTTSAAVGIAGLGGTASLSVLNSAKLTIPNGLIAGGTTGAATITVNGGSLTVGRLDLRNGTKVNYVAGGLNVGGNLTTSGDASVTLATGGNKVLRTGGLSMSDTSKIDLNDNDMIVGSGTGTTKAQVANLIKNARNGGSWDGASGITSTAAKNATPKNKTLGVLSGAEFTTVGGTGTFSGQPYVATDTLVKYTYYGDTDFNGLVNFDDYSRLDAGFNGNRTGWLNGDFDFNNLVNFDDYSLIDLAFNTQSGTLIRAMDYLEGEDRSTRGMDTPELQVVRDHFAQFGVGYAQSFLSAVPEPASSGVLIAMGGAALATRRSRRQRRQGRQPSRNAAC